MNPHAWSRWSLVVALLAAVPAAAQTPDCAAPNILILLDVSGSMRAATNPAGKYAAAVPAIDTVVTNYQDEVRFGLMVFPDPAQGFCGVSTNLVVVPALHTAEAIRNYLTLGASGFFGGPLATFDTPMKQALDAVAGQSVLRDPERRSYVVLITDGMQDCCRSGDYDSDPDCLPGSTTLDPVEVADNRADLVEAIGTLVGQGIQVFVVGFGSGVDALTLNEMAVTAGTALFGCDPSEPDLSKKRQCFYRVDESADPADATAALRAALATVVRITGTEVCDGLDNDCDGETDEGFSPGLPCDGDDDDLCADGWVTCTWDGRAECREITPPNRKEVCDGVDNDCDGVTDEGFAVREPCDGEDEDRCREGFLVCAPDGLGVVCDEKGPAHVETCNGRDDDCDGVVDEDSDVVCDSPCGVSLRRCIDGKLGDCEAPRPLPEDVCGNGRDDDCDGETDEDWEHACHTACGEGVESCRGGVWTPCTAPAPQDESCNLLDDDCNGAVDDGDLCGAGAECFCGACQAPCPADGRCLDGRACVQGFCLDDRCPEGLECRDRACAEPIPAPTQGPMAVQGGGGCGCRSGGLPTLPGGVLLGLLAWAGALLALRRRGT